MSPKEPVTPAVLEDRDAPYVEPPKVVPESTTRDALPYTGTPWRLFLSDVKLFFCNLRYLPHIFLPLRASSRSAELYPTPANLVDIAFHSILFVTQLGFIVSLVALAFLPTWIYVGYIAGFFLVNELICRHFNRFIPLKGLKSKEDDHSLMWKAYPKESWIFLNGICVGNNWLQHNVDRLSRTFHRPVVGIHNKTAGVIFDLVQCLIQRSLNYATQDVRDCYLLVKDALLDENKTKVVLILHSQGGIEGGMILDWLLDEMPHDNLKKLEIYTFGALANHFSNPVRADDPETGKPVPAIRHIEHYANNKDFACRFGVLNFTKHFKKKGWANRFLGQVFVNRRGGHQLNQHYLDGMFPLDPTQQFAREPLEDDFMNTIARFKLSSDGTPQRVVKGKLPKGVKVTKGNRKTKVEVAENEVPRIKDLSRLWQYRNGGVPIETTSTPTTPTGEKKSIDLKLGQKQADGGTKEANGPKKDVDSQKKDIIGQKKDIVSQKDIDDQQKVDDGTEDEIKPTSDEYVPEMGE